MFVIYLWYDINSDVRRDVCEMKHHYLHKEMTGLATETLVLTQLLDCFSLHFFLSFLSLQQSAFIP